MVLDISISDDDYNTVRTTLQEIQPEMLLFTRRLRQIVISFESDSPQETVYHISTPADEPPFIYVIQRNDKEDTKKYLVHSMEVSGMHKHLSRPDVTKSQIK
jgi:hypothetical protein